MFPIVSPEAKTISTPPLLVRSAQFILVPLHEPDRKSTTASKFAEPITVISCATAVATKLYQTSSLAVPVRLLHVIAAKD